MMRKGSGCGTIGRAVTSETRDPQFESHYWHIFIDYLQHCVNTKDENKGLKRSGKASLSKARETHTHIERERKKKGE